MRITIEHCSHLGWVVRHPHRISGLPQTVAYDKDRAEAIRQAETALHISFPERVKDFCYGTAVLEAPDGEKEK